MAGEFVYLGINIDMNLIEEIQTYQHILNEYSGRVYFEGILCTVDQPSEKPPNGARGHQIELSSGAAVGAIKTLIGAPVNYKAGWKGHDVNVTIGIITSAFFKEKQIIVRGYLMTTKYPDIIEEISMAKEPLGMSYELNGGRVEDFRDQVWKITHIGSFTGVAIL